jgi:O-antigen/teichoic acid export membrane protein
LDKLARPTGQLLLVVTLGSVGGTAVLAGAWVAPYAVVLPLAVAWLLTMLRRARISPGGSVGGPWGSFWRFTGPRALAGLAQIVLQRLDILLVAWFLGPADAALYTAATRFLVLGQLGNQAISAPMEPQISMALAKNDMRAARDVYATSTTWLICVTWPLFILVGVFAPLLLSWFGAGYGDAWPVTLTLSLVMLVAIGCGPVDVVLIMAGRTTWNLANTALALVLNVSMNLLLIPRMGLLGAALAWAAAVLATNLIPLLQLRVAFGLHPFRPGTILAAGLSLVCVALPAILIRWVGDEGPDTLLLSLLAGGCLYLAALWRYRRPLRLDVLIGSLRAGRRPSAVST